MLGPGRMTYQRARDLLLLAGLVVLALVTLTMLLRGVDPIEVTATLLYAPLFVGLLFFGGAAGLTLAVAATATYLALRWPAIRLVGFPALSGLILSRVAGYLAFGSIGGWAASQLRASLDKLALHDEIDDETGLHNARSFLAAIDRERRRADRYASVFSVVVASFEDPWSGLSGRRRAAELRKLGLRLGSSVRGSDHVSHARETGRHVIALVLPETGAEGAATVAANLTAHVRELAGNDARTETTTFPDGGPALEAMTTRFRAIDATERPAP